jgi:hypothetical protein
MLDNAQEEAVIRVVKVGVVQLARAVLENVGDRVVGHDGGGWDEECRDVAIGEDARNGEEGTEWRAPGAANAMAI